MSNSDSDDKFRSFDSSHTFTVDEAVLILLGYGINLAPDYDDFGLSNLLEEKQEAADANYGNALFEYKQFKAEMDEDSADDQQKLRELNEVVTEWRAALDDAHRMIERAGDYVLLLGHELVKIKNGKESLLELDVEKTKKTGQDQITRVSFHAWVKNIFNFSNDEAVALQPRENDGASKTTAQKNTEVTLFLLAKALADLVDKVRDGEITSKDLPEKLTKRNDRPNISAVVRFLLKNTQAIYGQEERALQGRLSKANKNTTQEDVVGISSNEIGSTLETASDEYARHDPNG